MKVKIPAIQSSSDNPTNNQLPNQDKRCDHCTFCSAGVVADA
jgi:hypothetical protein